MECKRESIAKCMEMRGSFFLKSKQQFNVGRPKGSILGKLQDVWKLACEVKPLLQFWQGCWWSFVTGAFYWHSDEGKDT